MLPVSEIILLLEIILTIYEVSKINIEHGKFGLKETRNYTDMSMKQYYIVTLRTNKTCFYFRLRYVQGVDDKIIKIRDIAQFLYKNP